MTHYINYTVTEFTTDEAFIDWVLGDDATIDMQWQNWLQANPSKKADIEAATALVRSFQEAATQADQKSIEEVWLRLQQNIQTNNIPQIKTWKTRMLPFLRIAAMLVVIAGTYYGASKIYDANHTLDYATNYGETKKVELADGTVVYLNANSRLSLKKGWQTEPNREVLLEGEAYFVVQHQSNNQPFIVHTNNNVDIRVLGTEFNVMNRHNDVQVLLNKGSVQLERTMGTTTDKLLMKPGELVQTNKGSLTKMNQQAVDAHLYTAWKESKAVFQNADIQALRTWLGDNHNINLEIPNHALDSIKFNGEFPASNWKVLIKALESTYNLSAQYTDDKVILKPM